MPKYFFHLVHTDGSTVPDDEGLELKDDHAARREAAVSISDLIADSLDDKLKPLQITVEIVQEDGQVVDRLTGQLTLHQQQPEPMLRRYG